MDNIEHDGQRVGGGGYSVSCEHDCKPHSASIGQPAWGLAPAACWALASLYIFLGTGRWPSRASRCWRGNEICRLSCCHIQLHARLNYAEPCFLPSFGGVLLRVCVDVVCARGLSRRGWRWTEPHSFVTNEVGACRGWCAWSGVKPD